MSALSGRSLTEAVERSSNCSIPGKRSKEVLGSGLSGPTERLELVIAYPLSLWTCLQCADSPILSDRVLGYLNPQTRAELELHASGTLLQALRGRGIHGGGAAPVYKTFTRTKRPMPMSASTEAMMNQYGAPPSSRRRNGGRASLRLERLLVGMRPTVRGHRCRLTHG